ncbi:MAG: hypothetical protein HY929_01485 [Euryarchaeota archaeon]|nr:hypothetical protein [Euryarchaeota archaeon]
MVKSFAERLDQAGSLADIFEIVKDAVRKIYGFGRAGLTLGLAELGFRKGYFIGAFYPVGSNIIVMNKSLLKLINEADPSFFKPYAFYILLHEYIHSLGNIDENRTEEIAYKIALDLFGPNHLVTLVSKNPTEFFKKLYPALDWQLGWQPQEEPELYIEMVPDFDKSSMSYIA